MTDTKTQQQIRTELDSSRVAAERLTQAMTNARDRDELTTRQQEQIVINFDMMVNAVEAMHAQVHDGDSNIDGRLAVARCLAELPNNEEFAALVLSWGLRTCLSDEASVDGTWKTTLAASLGEAMQGQAIISSAARKDAKLFDRFAKLSHGWCPRTLGKLKARFNLATADIDAHDWAVAAAYVLDMTVHNTYCFDLIEKTRNDKTVCWFRLSAECQGMIDEGMAQDLAMAFIKLPMVVKPTPHAEAGGTGGGWNYSPLTGVGRSRMGNHLTGVEENLCLPERYIAEVDRLAATPYVVRKDVLAVAQAVLNMGKLWKKGDGGLFDYQYTPVPKKRKDLDTAERKQLEQEIEEIRTRNAQFNSQKNAINMAVEIADRFKTEENIYFPVSCDTRGRVYFRTPFLSPQGDTFSKGVLQFRDGKRLGTAGVDALRRFIATFVTQGGIDKSSAEEQIQWTVTNQQLLEDIADNPLAHMEVWGKTDSPFEFLAATFELVYALRSGDATTYYSRLPVRIDAVASGLQHLGAISRDEKVAEAVQLVPGADGPDFYVRVAEATNALLDLATPTWWKDLVGEKSTMGDWDIQPMAHAVITLGGTKRKDAKPVSMQRTYAVTERTIADRLLQAGWEDKLDTYALEVLLISDKAQRRAWVAKAGLFLSHTQFAAVNSFASKAMDVMNWYQECVRILGSHGWQYTNPAGFTFRQYYCKEKTKRLRTTLGDLTFKVKGKGLDSKRQVNGISANQTHCMDACLLIMAAEHCGDIPLTAIHDSMGCLAADLDILQGAVRQAHVDIYEPCRLTEMRQQNQDRTGVELPPVPELGDLDPTLVLQSEGYWA